jgi:polycystin 1L2
LTFIPSTLLVAFFRRIRQHRSVQHASPVTEALSKLQTNQAFEITTTTRREKVKKKKKKNRLLFPWWCVFIAYGLSFLLISISIILTIARGIEFGEMKMQKWLASLATGFLSSVLLSQPIKVSFCTISYEIILNFSFF